MFKKSSSFPKSTLALALFTACSLSAADQLSAPDQKIRRSFDTKAAFALIDSTPTRIFTPNGDGVNDTFTLKFDNPAGEILPQKKIFDINGSDVADFQVVGDETAATVTLVWNGRNTNGEIVRSGIYIYQVQAENRIINGTVVVAR